MYCHLALSGSECFKPFFFTKKFYVICLKFENRFCILTAVPPIANGLLLLSCGNTVVKNYCNLTKLFHYCELYVVSYEPSSFTSLLPPTSYILTALRNILFTLFMQFIRQSFYFFVLFSLIICSNRIACDPSAVLVKERTFESIFNSTREPPAKFLRKRRVLILKP